MDQRIDNEPAKENEKERRKLRRWPDDGLAARHKVVRPSPHHPAALIAELFWR